MTIRFLEKTRLKIIMFAGLMLLVFSSYGWGQNEGDTIWTRVYGDTAGQMSNSVVQTSDGGFAVAGLTKGFNSADFWLLKIQSNGDTSWTRTYGTDDNEQAQSLKQTSDGGYIIAGWVKEDTSGFSIYNIYVVKTYPDGDPVWTWRYAGHDYAYAYDVEETTDGGYVIVGKTGRLLMDYNAYLVKLDADGRVVWERVYGGPDHQEGYDVELTLDGGYVITGHTGTCPDYDVYLIKVNANGDSLWGQTYGDSLIDTGYSVKATSDSGYIIAGCTEYTTPGTLDAYFIKTDSIGNMVWTSMYGGPFTDEAYSIYPAYGGNYIATGYYGPSGRDTQIYALKLEADGDTSWTRLYGGSSWDLGNSVVQAFDGSFLIAGGSSSFATNGQYDVYLLRIAGPQLFGSMDGYVTDDVERAPIENVYVNAGENGTWTNEYGYYNLRDLAVDRYDVSFTHPDYQDTVVAGVLVAPGSTTTLNMQMTTAYGSIAGHVSDAIERAPIESVYVSTALYETWTDQYGNYDLSGVLAGTYDVSFSHPDYQDTTETGVEVTGGNVTMLNVLMVTAGCDYIVGDVNGSDSYNGLDITFGVAFFKGGSDPMCPFGSCPISPCDAFFYCGDVNGSCSYNGLDITYGVAYFKGGDNPFPCGECPPPGDIAISQDEGVVD